MNALQNLASTQQPQKRNAIEDIYPLSPMQQGLLFHSLLSPTAGVYIPQVTLSLSGDLDSQTLKQAWQCVLNRHSVLRTSFYWEQRDQPFQVVYREIAAPWVEQDWRSLSAIEQSTKLSAVLACNRSEPFDLNQPPLIRLTWVRYGDDRYHLIWCYHHLILDGWSASQVLKEVFQQYFALTGRLPAVSVSPLPPYGNYIAWLNRQDVKAGQDFWRTYLQGWNGPIPLPIIKTRHPSGQTSQNTLSEQQRVFSPEMTQQLRTFVQHCQITLNTLVQGALGLVLSRYSDTHDVVFGAACAGRPADLSGALSMVGLFINTLPVRVNIESGATVAEWLQKLSMQQSTATAYDYVSLRELQAQISVGRPLFDCLLVFESYPVAVDIFKAQTGIELEAVQFHEWTHFPLTLLVAEGEQLTLTAKYGADQISPDDVTRLLESLSRVIVAFSSKPQSHLREITLLSPAEHQQLVDWNCTAKDYPLAQSLPDLFDAQAKQTPNATAVVFDAQSLTYHELHQQANQLADHLRRQGIGLEHRVAIYLERSLSMAVTLLAVVKAGAAYVPLDPSYPDSRLQWMLADANVSAVITDKSLDLPSLSDTITLIDISDGSQQSVVNPEYAISPDSSLYVIYTSGSTGQPKGVINTHQGLVNRLYWMQQTYGLTASDRVLHKTPLSFDVSVWELFWPWLNGAMLVIAKPNGHKDSAYLVNTIRQQRITTLHFVPSMLAAFLEEPDVSNCTHLKRVICSGEALTPHLQQQFFRQLPAVELHNLYGPTEAAIDVTAWQCQPDSPTVPIGRPIANTQIYLLDQDHNPVPIGIPGELHIGGVGVARGYLNRPALTAEKFIPNPFLEAPPLSPSPPLPIPPSPILYKTGDLARYRPDGAIEYLGRRDHQVKLRGVRIELGEIEAALGQHPEVRQAVVLLRDDLSGGSALVAYIVGDVDHFADLKRDLSAFLKQQLPDVMTPSAFVSLDALPLTPNGKLDRRALPLPATSGRFERIAPRNQTERAIAAIWAEVLQIDDSDDINVDDNFFDLGGHSLNATRVNLRLRKQFDLELPLHSLFEHPTLEALATHIDALRIAARPQPMSQPVGHKEIEL